MNYLGHVAVALRTGRHDRDYVLGAALPDLTSMLGMRIDRSALPGPVADGVACHLAADTAFHAHAAFRAGSAALRHDLGSAGFATGPRRAIGHAGWELLLDGTLVGSPAETAYREALAGASALTDVVAVEHRARWRSLANGGQPPALRYDDPEWVADRLVAMLSRRPRLAVDPTQAPVIVGVLARHQVSIASVAAAVIDDVGAATTAANASSSEAGPP